VCTVLAKQYLGSEVCHGNVIGLVCKLKQNSLLKKDDVVDIAGR